MKMSDWCKKWVQPWAGMYKRDDPSMGWFPRMINIFYYIKVPFLFWEFHFFLTPPKKLTFLALEIIALSEPNSVSLSSFDSRVKSIRY